MAFVTRERMIVFGPFESGWVDVRYDDNTFIADRFMVHNWTGGRIRMWMRHHATSRTFEGTQEPGPGQAQPVTYNLSPQTGRELSVVYDATRNRIDGFDWQIEVPYTGPPSALHEV